LQEKYDQMCLVVSIGSLTCLIFLIGIRYKILGNKIEVAEWDLNIVTVDDYSVELPISKIGYNDWVNNVFRGTDGDYSRNISPGLSLKRYLINEIEE
jgi:hypothetical protein